MRGNGLSVHAPKVLSLFHSSAPEFISPKSGRKRYQGREHPGSTKLITVEEDETNILEPAESPKPMEEGTLPEVEKLTQLEEPELGEPELGEPSKPEAQQPQAAQGEEVQRRDMSQEKKKVRRIRSNSKVESVV